MIYDPTQSHFDLDRERGQQGELFVDSVREALAKKNSRIEVKTDAYFVSANAAKKRVGRFYIERQSRGRDGFWYKSGIETTKADLWFFVFGRHPGGFVIDTDWLRRATLLAAKDERNLTECSYGENPTRGVFVYMTHFLDTRATDRDEH